MNIQTKDVKNIVDFLKSCQISSGDYESSNQPFFQKDNIENCVLFDDMINNKLNLKLDFFDNLLENGKEIPKKIIYLYKILENPNKEIYFNDIIFMSYNEIVRRYTSLKDKQPQFMDIAYSYMGMGYVQVKSINLTNAQIIERTDGGSNDWDRKHNQDEFINLDPYITKGISINDFFLFN